MWRRWRAVAEYDGWYHDRSAGQRDYDILRAERLTHIGLNVVVLTSADYARPERLVQRTWANLQRGWYPRERAPFDHDRWQDLIFRPKRRPDPAPDNSL